jgi:hypothetical protein
MAVFILFEPQKRKACKGVGQKSNRQDTETAEEFV